MKINALEMGTKKSSQVIPVINDLIKEIEDLKEIIKEIQDSFSDDLIYTFF